MSQMTRENWGPGRNLKIKIFDETDHSDLETEVNGWLIGLGEEKILGMYPTVDTFQSQKAEIYHLFVLFSTE